MRSAGFVVTLMNDRLTLELGLSSPAENYMLVEYVGSGLLWVG